MKFKFKFGIIFKIHIHKLLNNIKFILLILNNLYNKFKKVNLKVFLKILQIYLIYYYNKLNQKMKLKMMVKKLVNVIMKI